MIRSAKLRAALVASGSCLVGALLALPASRGVTLTCARVTAGAVPTCEIDEPGTFFFGGTKLRFDGREDAFSATAATVGGDTPVTTVHVGGQWTSRPLAADRAYTTAIAYGAFVRAPEAMTLERRMPSSGLAVVLPVVLFLASAAIFLVSARRLERSIAIIFDAERDEIVFETRWLRRTSVVHTVALSSITEVNVVAVEDSDRYDLCASMTDGERRALLRVGYSDCEAAAELIRAKAKIS